MNSCVDRVGCRDGCVDQPLMPVPSEPLHQSPSLPPPPPCTSHILLRPFQPPLANPHSTAPARRGQSRMEVTLVGMQPTFAKHDLHTSPGKDAYPLASLRAGEQAKSYPMTSSPGETPWQTRPSSQAYPTRHSRGPKGEGRQRARALSGGRARGRPTARAGLVEAADGELGIVGGADGEVGSLASPQRSNNSCNRRATSGTVKALPNSLPSFFSLKLDASAGSTPCSRQSSVIVRRRPCPKSQWAEPVAHRVPVKHGTQPFM